MLTVLAALLLSGPPSARAEDSVSTKVAADAADANGDGTVTGKERRQQRRAERRARRGSKGEWLTDEEADAADTAESGARGTAASSRAAGAAAALKSTLPSADAGAFPGGTGASEGSAKPREDAPAGKTETTKSSEYTAGATGDVGNPKSPSDYAIAARSGYAPAFAAAGLKLGPDGKSVVRLDGKPATAEDYARLQREIGSMPAAIGRRPDFFNTVSPAHYADLKRGYKERKEGDTVYKDVGTTEGDRDFVHTASCSKLSGDCNKNVEKASYKKGDFVAPEDLDNMWDALQKELDGSAEAGGLPSLGETRSDIAREKALQAARALSDGGFSDEDAIKSATKEGPAAAPTAVSKAVDSVKRLWKRASGSALPGATGAADGENDSLPLIAGAAALAVLGAGALFLRRKG